MKLSAIHYFFRWWLSIQSSVEWMRRGDIWRKCMYFWSTKKQTLFLFGSSEKVLIYNLWFTKRWDSSCSCSAQKFKLVDWSLGWGTHFSCCSCILHFILINCDLMIARIQKFQLTFLLQLASLHLSSIIKSIFHTKL